MSILFITEFFPDLKLLNFSGGVETRAFFTVCYLPKKYQIVIVCRRKRGEKKYEKKENIKIIRLGRPVNNTEVNLYSIFSRLYFIVQSFLFSLKFKPDLIEGSNFVCYPQAFLLAKIKHIPVVAWYPDLLLDQWLKKFGFLTGISGLILEKISLLFPWDWVIALSKETKKKLIKTGVSNKKITIIYGGADIDFIKKIKIKKTEKPKICCISRLVSYKNVDCLLKAMVSIKDKIKNVRLVVIGKGPAEEKLKKLTESLGLEEEVSFRKDLSYKALLEELKSSHLLVLPSEIEGFGLVTVEALAAETPFLIADIAINREVTRGKGGGFFKLNNSHDLAEKTLKILKNKQLAESLLREGKPLLSSYNWKEVSRQTAGVYQKVL